MRPLSSVDLQCSTVYIYRSTFKWTRYCFTFQSRSTQRVCDRCLPARVTCTGKSLQVSTPVQLTCTAARCSSTTARAFASRRGGFRADRRQAPGRLGDITKLACRQSPHNCITYSNISSFRPVNYFYWVRDTARQNNIIFNQSNYNVRVRRINTSYYVSIRPSVQSYCGAL